MTPAEGLRFSPPEEELPQGLAEVLWLAFAADSSGGSRSEHADSVSDLAERLGLAARIGQRRDEAELRAILGAETAEKLMIAHRSAVVRAMAYEHLAMQVAEAAAEILLPLVFLKGLALPLAGIAEVGSRTFSDLDLLVPESRAMEFQDLLTGRGFRAAGPAVNDQHLPPLLSPVWGALDVHFRLRGLRLRGDLQATFLDLEELLGLCRPVTSLPGRCFVPDRDVLAAHALSHGIEQHGFRPGGYPLLRMSADLADLLPDEAAWREFAERGYPWIRHGVSSAELQAARSLSLSLTKGRLPDEAGEAGAATLLRHMVLGSLDTDYCKELRPSHTADRLRQVRAEARLTRYVKAKLFPSREELVYRYGGAEGLAGRAWRRLLHPAGLLTRLAADGVRRLASRPQSRPTEDDDTLR